MTDASGKPPNLNEADTMRMSSTPLQELLRLRAIDPPVRPGLLGNIDRFEVLRFLGMGGMGIVLLARDPNDGARVAIKLMRPELASDPRVVHRFVVEARHMQKMSHPGILRVLEVSEQRETPYFVLPYMERGSLAQMIRPGEPMQSDRTLSVVLQVAKALTYAHSRGIIHRDLKPGNILIDASGSACLADFGLLRTFFNDSALDVEASQCEGTAPYMSPAVAAGEAEDTRCDIYSFGAMLYEMLTGQTPYSGRSAQEILRKILAGPPKPIAQVNPEAPPRLVKIAEGAMARELRDRYARMADVAADLELAKLGREPLGPHGQAQSLVRWPGRARRAVPYVAVVVLMLGVGALALRHFGARLRGGVPGSGQERRPPIPALPKPLPRIPEEVHSFGLREMGKLEVPGVLNWSGLRKGDWDGDGEPDFFMIRDQKLFVLSAQGQVLERGSLSEHGPGLGLFRVEDVDKDRRDDVFVAWSDETRMHMGVLNQHLYMKKRFSAKGSMLRDQGGVISQSSLLPRKVVDLNHDGRREFIAATTNGYGLKPRGISCFDFEDGALLWDYQFGPAPLGVEVCDVNGDGNLDVIAGSRAVGNGSEAPDGTNDGRAYLFALSDKGARLWIKDLGAGLGVACEPIFIDSDKDRKKAILAWVHAPSRYRGGEIGKIVRLDTSGATTATYDAGVEILSCRAADVDGDGKMEVVATDRMGNVHALTSRLAPLLKARIVSAVCDKALVRLEEIVDFDGDGRKELVLTSSEVRRVSGNNPGFRDRPGNVEFYDNNSIWILNSELKPLARYVVAAKWKRYPEFSVLVADMNGDGRAEIISLSDQAVILGLEAPAPKSK